MTEDSILAKRITKILSGYVDGSGRVNYHEVQEINEVKEAVQGLRVFDLSQLTNRKEKIAFWVNAYNTLAIAAVLSELKKDPDFLDRGIDGFIKKVNFFSRRKHIVGGKSFSLNAIENQILRRELKEPRVHFALVCGAESCPILKNGLYSAENIDTELDIAAKLFINSQRGSHLDKGKMTIHLSKIFKWFQKDFGGSSKSVINFIAKYHNEKDFLLKNTDKLEIQYMDYDWSINESKKAV